MKQLIFKLNVILFLCVLSSCKSKKYNYDESVRSLKILNSDLVNFFNAISEKKEFEAMTFLWNYPSSPVPFKKEEFTVGKPEEVYDFEKLKGKYVLNPETQEFTRVEESGEIEISYTLPKSDFECLFIITSFKHEEITSRPKFPVDVNVKLLSEGKESLRIRHHATVEDDLPKELTTVLEQDDFLAKVTFSRTREGDLGRIQFNLDCSIKGSSFVTVKITAGVGYSSMGYYFKKIEMDNRLFNHELKGVVHYDKIDPTSGDYVDSWNTNSEIEIFELPMKVKVGNVVLGKTGNNELQDYFIRFSNGQEELLSSYLPYLDRLLNFKY